MYEAEGGLVWLHPTAGNLAVWAMQQIALAGDFLGSNYSAAVTRRRAVCELVRVTRRRCRSNPVSAAAA